MRKKLSEMTPFERVLPRLKGMSNEEAEEVAVKILAQLVAKHVHVEKDGEKYIPLLMEKICKSADAYSQENAGVLAMAAVAKRFERESCKIVKMQ